VGAAPAFRTEPDVGLRDYAWCRRPAWADLDWEASRLIGCPGTAIPSVRVALGWTLEYLGCRRHTDHVLLPRFVGRCILNSLNRFALPVETVTPPTRAVVVVHQYGFTQRLEAISAACAAQSVPYMEDSPFGVGPHEQLGAGSLAKFIGFSKVLPALKGGFALCRDPALTEFLEQKRAGWSAWSWPLLGLMAVLRHGRHAAPSSVLGDVAYELFPAARGDNGMFRGNLWRALGQMPSFERVVAARLHALAMLPAARVHLPDTTRLASVVPFRPAGDPRSAQAVFRKHGFDATVYHFDAGRNLFDPCYEEVLLIPLNPRIPARAFTRLVEDLAAFEGA
jgi:hypothetical protein